MLTILFVLAGIWTWFWFVMLVLDWGDRTSFSDSKALCATCAKAASVGKANDAKQFAPSTTKPITQPAAAPAQKPAKAPAKASQAANDADNVASFANAQAAAKKTAQDAIIKKPVADKHDQVNVTPLFEAPSNEKDDLKTIKGIGVVMERTLNDLGITTFKQLAGFKQAEVKMVSDVLSESKAGFGDRIERDEWVDQAKDLVNKAS